MGDLIRVGGGTGGSGGGGGGGGGAVSVTKETYKTVQVGTIAEQNPWRSGVSSPIITVAHGLGKIPDFYETYIECVVALSTDNYVLGDRIPNVHTPWRVTIQSDAINTYIISSNSGSRFGIADNNSGRNSDDFTASQWKFVAVPFIHVNTEVVTQVTGSPSSTVKVNQTSNTALKTVVVNFGNSTFTDIPGMDAWPANAVALFWNGGRSHNNTSAAYAGGWHEIRKTQWDRLGLNVVDAGDTATQANSVLIREFIAPSATTGSGITGRDTFWGRDADDKPIVGSWSSSEDFYPLSYFYELHETVTVGGGGTIIDASNDGIPDLTDADVGKVYLDAFNHDLAFIIRRLRAGTIATGSSSVYTNTDFIGSLVVRPTPTVADKLWYKPTNDTWYVSQTSGGQTFWSSREFNLDDFPSGLGIPTASTFTAIKWIGQHHSADAAAADLIEGTYEATTQYYYYNTASQDVQYLTAYTAPVSQTSDPDVVHVLDG